MKDLQLKKRQTKTEEFYYIYKIIEARQDKIKAVMFNNHKIIKMLIKNHNFKEAEKIEKYNDKLNKRWEKTLILSNYYFKLWLNS